MAIFRCEAKGGGKQIKSAGAKSDYVQREGKYASKGGLVFGESVNMPTWASNSRDFWKAHDNNERANGSSIREFIVSLPAELSAEQQVELSRSFAATLATLGGKNPLPTTVAIHESKTNPHAHILLCERPNSAAGQVCAKDFFSRKNPKVTHFNGRHAARTQMLLTIRESWAVHANAALAAAGHSVRISHLSNADQGLDRIPQPKLGPKVVAMLKAKAGGELRVANAAEQMASHYVAKKPELKSEIAVVKERFVAAFLAPITTNAEDKLKAKAEAQLNQTPPKRVHTVEAFMYGAYPKIKSKKIEYETALTRRKTETKKAKEIEFKAPDNQLNKLGEWISVKFANLMHALARSETRYATKSKIAADMRLKAENSYKDAKNDFNKAKTEVMARHGHEWQVKLKKNHALCDKFDADCAKARETLASLKNIAAQREARLVRASAGLDNVVAISKANAVIAKIKAMPPFFNVKQGGQSACFTVGCTNAELSNWAAINGLKISNDGVISNNRAAIMHFDFSSRVLSVNNKFANNNVTDHATLLNIRGVVAPTDQAAEISNSLSNYKPFAGVLPSVTAQSHQYATLTR